jgi:gas vesicle protein
MFAGWRSLRRQFAPEAFVAPGMEELGRVGRSVQQHLIAAADAATPRLLALVSERWEAFLPRLARVLQQEMEQLRSNLVTVMEDDLARMVTEVVDGKQDRLKRELPQFKDEARREIFRQQLENRLHDTSVAVTQTAYAANQEAIENLLINIGDFEADNPFGRLSDEQLNRRYLSLWLRLVDHHVLNEPIESGVSP